MTQYDTTCCIKTIGFLSPWLTSNVVLDYFFKDHGMHAPEREREREYLGSCNCTH